VIDPELIVLGGAIADAGGTPLLDLVGDELAELAVSRPRLALSSVPRNPVLTGALHEALTTAKAKLFPVATEH
jgi:hypothetical protein